MLRARALDGLLDERCLEKKCFVPLEIPSGTHFEEMLLGFEIGDTFSHDRLSRQ